MTKIPALNFFSPFFLMKLFHPFFHYYVPKIYSQEEVAGVVILPPAAGGKAVMIPDRFWGPVFLQRYLH